MSVTITSSTMSADQMAQNFGQDDAVQTQLAPTAVPPPPDTPGPVGDTPPDTPAEDAAPKPDDVAEPPADAVLPPERRVSRAQQRVNDALRKAKQNELGMVAEKKRADDLAAELARMKVAPVPDAAPAQPEPVAAPDDPEPQEDDFTDWQAWQIAVAKHAGRQEARRLVAEDRAAMQREADTLRIQRERIDAARAYHERQVQFVTEAPDFDQVVNQDIAISQPMSYVIATSQIGPEIAYFMGKNPTEAARIAQLPPDAALTDMHRLEGRLIALREVRTSTTPPPALAPVSTPSAPPPPPGLPSGHVVTTPSIYTARTYKEFEDAENKRLAARGQRG